MIDKLLREAELARAIYYDKLNKIAEIRKNCKHEFVEGRCIHCKYSMEEFD